ncbi:DUF6049 family protein [Nakamurella deserti]|uniref:DUF6049 family protein n=1 Tax=Nakamurella deserti TaxID=2164074 RepID=UPI000DBE0A2D|nr:DUF6049 family protein [Nakamurella deserti]
MTRPVRRIRWLLAAVLAVAVSTPLVTTPPPAGAAAPQGEYAGTLRFEVRSLTPALVSPTESTVVIRGSMVNTGSEELTGVVARFQRGEALSSTDEVRRAIDDPGQPESVLTGFTPVTDTIAAGQTVDFTLETDAFSRPRVGLGVTAPGVYPVMVNVNAGFDSGPEDGARVGELHTLLTVGSVPGGTPATGTRQAVSMLMPLVDRPHRDPTGAFFDDDLAALISTGGRLEDVLSAAEAPDLPAGAVTLAVDPELLEELRLMAQGYVVGPSVVTLGPADPAGSTTASSTTGAAPPPTGGATSPDTAGAAPSSPVAPSSAGLDTATTTSGAGAATTSATASDAAFQPVPGPDTVPGAGAGAAADFLGRLRALATTTPVLVLPYTDIDATAAVRANHPEQVTSAVAQGRALATAVLGPQAQLITDVGWPIDGLVDPMTLSVLRSTGQDTVVLDRAGVEDVTGDRATIGTGSGDVTAVLATASVPDSPVDLNHFTALTAQRWLSGDTAATVIAPPRSWQPDRDEYAALTDLMRTLGGSGLVDGLPIDRVASRAATGDGAAARLAYPDAAAARELPVRLFAEVQGLAGLMASTQAAFDPLPTDDRTTIAPDDIFAGTQAGLSRQAAGGFRADLGAANRSNAAVQDLVDAVQSGVGISPPASVYTLTSATSPLLVTIANRLPYAAHVRISVDASDAFRAGITVTDVGVQTVPAAGVIQVLLPSEVTRSGALSLKVKLTTPDGAAWGPEQELQLRSTAIGSFTVVLIIAAGAIVVLTTAIRIRKRYRQRRERIAAGLQ